VLRIVAVNLALTAALLLAVEGVVRLAWPEIGPAGMDAGLVAPERHGRTAGSAPAPAGTSSGPG